MVVVWGVGGRISIYLILIMSVFFDLVCFLWGRLYRRLGFGVAGLANRGWWMHLGVMGWREGGKGSSRAGCL